MVVRDTCAGCGSTQFKTNGHIHHGKQHLPCKARGRQCVATAATCSSAHEPRGLITHLVGERISLCGICRAVGVSLTGLLHVMVESFAACPEHVHARLPGEPTGVVIQRLEAGADELWSFIPWVWMAMDAKIRSRESGVQLWGKVPEVYHQQAVFHTDLSDVYEGIIPVQRRNAITKKAGRTDYIERLNNTLRPRVARLVRETLSFSKKLGNHLSAIKFFICRYHLAKAAALPV